MSQFPCLIRTLSAGGEARYALGDPLVERTSWVLVTLEAVMEGHPP
jgi:hypothetical protein